MIYANDTTWYNKIENVKWENNSPPYLSFSSITILRVAASSVPQNTPKYFQKTH
jgi:hypothetical protein